MAKNVGRSNRAWSDVDVISLLSWADICIKHDLDFPTTAQQYIQNNRNDTKQNAATVTYKQVEAKLRSLGSTYRHGGTSSKQMVDDIILMGSIHLNQLPKTIREQIGQRVKDYEDANHRSDNEDGIPPDAHSTIGKQDATSDDTVCLQLNYERRALSKRPYRRLNCIY